MLIHTFILIGTLIIPYSYAFFDSITDGINSNVNFVKNTICTFRECCDEISIPANFEKLEEDLHSNIFGQHIAVKLILSALKAHFDKNVAPKKALVLSFHGTPGTGKNYIADFIVESLYKKGSDSKYVHIYNGKSDFPLKSEVENYKVRLSEEVKEAIKNCPQSLFILNEVHLMHPGILETVSALMDYNTNSIGVNSKHAIFILVSNTAGAEIANRLNDLMKNGLLRENTEWDNFENMLEKTAFNVDGGMQKSALIDDKLVDHYIPFLPLEKEHVIKCIEAEIRRHKKRPNLKIVEKIFQKSVIFEMGLFAKSGCKILDKKVAAYRDELIDDK